MTGEIPLTSSRIDTFALSINSMKNSHFVHLLDNPKLHGSYMRRKFRLASFSEASSNQTLYFENSQSVYLPKFLRHYEYLQCFALSENHKVSYLEVHLFSKKFQSFKHTHTHTRTRASWEKVRPSGRPSKD